MSINNFSLYDGAYNSSIRRISGATSAYRNYVKQLSSGIRINSAADDAAGLYLGTKLNTVLMSNSVAKNNTQTGLNMLNIADGALGEMVDSLQRIRNLAVQAANGVYASTERGMMQQEITELAGDITQNYMSTKFGDKTLFVQKAANNINPIIPKTDLEITAAGYDEAHTIRTADDFVNKITGHESENFILATNINLASLGVQNSSVINNFSGQFDGNGCTVTGFNIDTGAAVVNNIGLFGTVTGTIKNLGIEEFSVNAQNGSYVGGLVGRLNGGTLENCYSKGAVVGNRYVGGLLGTTLASANVSYCYSEGSVNAKLTDAGGLIGKHAWTSTLSDSYSEASVISDGDTAGGLIGSNTEDATISGCYAAGSVTAQNYAGGIVGWFGGGALPFNSTIRNSYATSDVTVANQNAGGLVGHSQNGKIYDSYATGNISGTSNIGGVSGQSELAFVDSNDFYKNNMATDGGLAVNANVSPMPTAGWDPNVWNLSGALPTLKNLSGNRMSEAKAIALQVGTNVDESSRIDINAGFNLGSLEFDVKNADSALMTIDKIDKLINLLCEKRSDLGAQGNKLSSILVSQDNREETYSKSKSSIMDADMAKVQSAYVREQLLQNFSTQIFQQSKNINKNIVINLLS